MSELNDLMTNRQITEVEMLIRIWNENFELLKKAELDHAFWTHVSENETAINPAEAEQAANKLAIYSHVIEAKKIQLAIVEKNLKELQKPN